MKASDPIVEAVRCGSKNEALRLIAEKGVWTPFRDPGYFDTEECFPVFSSLELIPPFLCSLGFEGDSVKAHQMEPAFFSFVSHSECIVTLNPGTDSEWKFGPDELAAIVRYGKRG